MKSEHDKWIDGQNLKASLWTFILFVVMGLFNIGCIILGRELISANLGNWVWMLESIRYPANFCVPMILSRLYSIYNKENSYRRMGKETFMQYLQRMIDFGKNWYKEDPVKDVKIK